MLKDCVALANFIEIICIYLLCFKCLKMISDEIDMLHVYRFTICFTVLGKMFRPEAKLSLLYLIGSCGKILPNRTSAEDLKQSNNNSGCT